MSSDNTAETRQVNEPQRETGSGAAGEDNVTQYSITKGEVRQDRI